MNPHTHKPAGATAKEVAERAGVSVTTVSRVLSGHDGEISPATRSRVVDAANLLEYRPNSLAAALRRGVTNMIGLLVPDISDAYFHTIARGAEDAARENGYMVVFCNTDRDPERERDYVDLLLDKRVDGLIFCGGGVGDERHLARLDNAGTGTVTIGPHSLRFPSVRTDDAAAIESAVRHLWQQGCRRVLCLAGKPDWQVSRMRLLGYQRAIAELGLDDDDDLVVQGDFTQAAGYEHVERMLATNVEFDGVVAFNDYAATGAMLALADAGIRVPDEVAVVGCDDIALASIVHPTLTSVGFPQYEFGQAAMRKCLALVRDEKVQPETTYPYRLVVRASSDRSSPRR